MDTLRHSGTRVSYLKNLCNSPNLKDLTSFTDPTYKHHDDRGVAKIGYIFVSKPLLDTSTYRLLPQSPANTSPHSAIMLTITEVNMEVSNPSSKKKIIKLWNKVDKSLYSETMEQYLEVQTNVINKNDAIKYLPKLSKLLQIELSQPGPSDPLSSPNPSMQ